MVYDSNQKDYIQEKLNLFALLGACLGFQLPIPDCAMSKGWGGSYAQSPCTKLSEGPWRHPRGRGTRGDTRGHVAAGSSHNIRAEPGPPPTAVNALTWHQLSAAGRSGVQLQKVFYRKIMLSSNPPKSVFTFAPLQPLDTRQLKVPAIFF